MAVNVDIPGVGNVQAQNAAEEATLKEILRVLKGQGKGGLGGGGASSGGGGAGGNPSQVLTGLTKDLGKFSKGIKGTTTALQDFQAGLKSIGGAILDGFMSVASSAMNLGKELLVGGNRLSDFAQHIPLVGNALSGLLGILEGQIDTWRSLSEVGASFGNDIAKMNLAAANAGLGMEKFAEFVGGNSERMQFLGGTVTEGASQFGSLIKNVRNSEKGFFGMGYTMESLNEHTAEYIEMQARQGRLAGMSQAELQAGSEAYLEQIDQLAKVTGKSRKEAEALLKQQQEEANILVLKSKLEGQNLKNFENNMAFVQSELPGFANAFGDLADGVAQTPLGQMLAANVDGLSELQEQMGRGEIGQEEYQKKLKELMPQIVQFADGMGAAGVSALAGKAGMGELLNGLSDTKKFLSKSYDFKQAEKEQKDREKVTENLANMENAIEGARAQLMKTFLESGLFQNLQKYMGDFLGWFTDKGENGMSKMDEFLQEGLKWAEDFMKWVKGAWADAEGTNIVQKLQSFLGKLWEEKISPGLGAMWDGLMESIGPKLSEYFVSAIVGLLGAFAGVALSMMLGAVIGPIIAPFLAIAGALAAIFGWETIKEWFGAAWDMLKGVFEWIGNTASALWDVIKPLISAIWDIYKGMFGWIGDTFSWLWDKIEPIISPIVDGLMTMFGWIGDTIGWVWNKLKKLNPLNWFGGDDEDELEKAEEKKRKKLSESVGGKPRALTMDEVAGMSPAEINALVDQGYTVPKTGNDRPTRPTANANTVLAKDETKMPEVKKPSMPDNSQTGAEAIQTAVNSNADLSQLVALMAESNRLSAKNNALTRALMNDMLKGAL